MKIRTLNQLMQAALNRKAVECPGTDFRRVPAAFVIGMPGTVIHRLLQRGMAIYKPQKNGKKQTP